MTDPIRGVNPIDVSGLAPADQAGIAAGGCTERTTGRRHSGRHG